MPGPTTERLDDDFRSLREDLRAIQVTLARIDSRMSDLDNLRIEVRATTAGLATLTAGLAAADGRLGILDSRLTTLINAGKWLGSIFALTALGGAFSIWGRLGVVETQLKNSESRLVELRDSVSRPQTDSPIQLEERINRIARAAVDEAVRRANLPKPSP